MKQIKLTTKEILNTAQGGCMRQVEAIKNGLKNAHGMADKDKDWQYHLEGAMGERALAKHLGIYWEGVGSFGASDIKGGVEVKTRSEDWHDLIIHKNTDPDKICCLLTGRNGVYKYWGGIKASDGMKEEYFKDPTGERPEAYFVPKSELNMDIIPPVNVREWIEYKAQSNDLPHLHKAHAHNGESPQGSP